MAYQQEPFGPGTYYHVYHHANGNDNLFRCDENYRYFLEKYAYHIEPVATTYAYCLLPNHVHFLVKTRSPEEIATNIGQAAFQKFPTFGKLISKHYANLFSAYTQTYNNMFGRKGSLFIPNVKRKAIKDTRHLCNTVHYIHWNPVAHQLRDDAYDWRWSSLWAYVLDNPSRIDTEACIGWFGNLENFKVRHQESPHQATLIEMAF